MQIYAMSLHSWAYLVQHGVAYYISSLGALVIALVFYISQIPERFAPGGFFELWFSSHQLWHVFTFAVACLHYNFVRHFVV
jgi:adiponectin receptor